MMQAEASARPAETVEAAASARPGDKEELGLVEAIAELIIAQTNVTIELQQSLFQAYLCWTSACIFGVALLHRIHPA